MQCEEDGLDGSDSATAGLPGYQFEIKGSEVNRQS
jgi:hypothetical protein